MSKMRSLLSLDPPSFMFNSESRKERGAFRCPPCVENVLYILITEKSKKQFKLMLKIKFKNCELIEAFNIYGKMFLNIY